MEAGLTVRTISIIALLCEVSVAGFAQYAEPLDVDGKLRYHVKKTFGPSALALSGVKAGFLLMKDGSSEWGQGMNGYGKRSASSIGSSAMRGMLAFGLDTALHQDPRYFRSVNTGFFRRTGHALRGIVVTRTDKGGETLATWRLGSAYGAAFISNQWYPDRLNTTRRGFKDGSARLGFDFVKNMTAEFWPDIKMKIKRRKT